MILHFQNQLTLIYVMESIVELDNVLLPVVMPLSVDVQVV